MYRDYRTSSEFLASIPVRFGSYNLMRPVYLGPKIGILALDLGHLHWWIERIIEEGRGFE